MIEHIVMWKLKERTKGKIRQENAWTLRQELEKLPELIREIRYLETGISSEYSGDVYDAVLCAESGTEDSLREYLNHPVYVRISNLVSPARKVRHGIDYKV